MMENANRVSTLKWVNGSHGSPLSLTCIDKEQSHYGAFRKRYLPPHLYIYYLALDNFDCDAMIARGTFSSLEPLLVSIFRWQNRMAKCIRRATRGGAAHRIHKPVFISTPLFRNAFSSKLIEEKTNKQSILVDESTGMNRCDAMCRSQQSSNRKTHESFQLYSPLATSIKPSF